ncbi:MAG: hypothetical protein ACPF8V_05385 [Luteibaculum sp.]
MKLFRLLSVLSLFLLSGNLFSQPAEVHFPEIIVSGVEQEIVVQAKDSVQIRFRGENLGGLAPGEEKRIAFRSKAGSSPEIEINGTIYNTEKRAIPLWLSILPPLFAIVLALIFKEVVSSLLLGILVGSGVIGYYSGGFIAGLGGFFKVSGTYIIEALNDSGHLSVIVFSVLIGGIVTVISKNGGMAALVSGISKKATTAKKGQMATFFLGIAIFFDDYANTLVVGNTMRPITDRLKISREKLAYLVDSTAAPVAAIAFVTTWIGAELGYIKDGLKTVELSPGLEGLTPYSIFLSSWLTHFTPSSL